MEISQHPRTFDVVVEWVDDWPPEMRSAVEPIVDVMVHLLPRWARYLFLRWDGGDTDHEAISNISVPYRTVSLRFCPAFLDLGDAGRMDTAVHEVVHAYISGMRDVFWKTSEQLDETARELAQRWYKDAEEAAVVDLTERLVALVSGSTDG